MYRALLACLAVAACQVDATVPADASMVCVGNGVCPDGYRCVSGACVSLAANQPARITVGTPARALDVVSLPVSVADFDADLITFTATYSVDGGAELPATIEPLAVAASPTAASATLLWHAADDLGGASYMSGLIVHVVPSQGQAADSPVFDFGNDPPALVLPPIVGTKSGDVGVAFTAVDAASDIASVLIEFATGPAGPWASADISLGATTSLTTSPLGVSHAVIWNSRAAPDADPARPQGIGAGPLASAPAVYLRVRASDVLLGQTHTSAPVVTGPFSVDNTSNAPPGVEVITPTGVSGDVVLVSYTLTDPESDPCELVVELDAGDGYKPAAQGLGGDGQLALVSSASGTAHVFAWDSVADAVGLSSTDVVTMRIAARGPGQGVFAQSQPFSVDNQVHNQPPEVAQVVSTGGVAAGEAVGIPIIMRDAESDPVSVEVEYQDASGAWRVATADASGPTTALSTSPSGTLHTFVWRSLSDAVAPSWRNVPMRTRIRQANPARDGAWVAFSLAVDNGPSLNHAPTIEFVDAGPVAVYSSDYESYLLVRDAESDPVFATDFAFTVNGIAWLSATTDLGASTSLPSSPEGELYRFVWHAAADLAVATDLLGDTPIPMLSLRVGVRDAYGEGVAAIYDHDLAALELLAETTPPLVPVDQSVSSSGLTGLVSSGNGVVHVFWVTPFGAQPYSLRHSVSRDAGVTWAASNVVTADAAYNHTATTAVGSSTLLVAYSVVTSTTRQLRVRRSTNGGSTWSAAIDLTTTATDAAYPSFFHESANIVHLVWRDYASSNSRVYYARTTDGGVSWSTPVAVSALEAVQYPAPAVATVGSTIHVVWLGASATAKHATSTNAGASFAAPTTAFTAAGNSYGYQLLPTPDGALHLIAGQGGAVRVRWSSVGGWGSKETLDATCANRPYAFYDAEGARLLVFCYGQDPKTLAYQTHLAQSEDQGISWSAPSVVAPGQWNTFAYDASSGVTTAAAVMQLSLPANYPFAAPLPHLGLSRVLADVNNGNSVMGFDGAGTLRSLWRGNSELTTAKKSMPWTSMGSIGVANPTPLQILGRGPSLYAAYITDIGFGGPIRYFSVAGSDDGGDTWTPLAPGAARSGSLAVDRAGAGYAVIVPSTVADTLAFIKSTNSGASWSTPASLSSLGTQNLTPSLVWWNGKLRLAYVDASGTFDVVRYSDSADGVSWSAPLNVSNNATRDAGYPRLTVGAHGRMHIVWGENTGSAWQLRAASSTNAGVSFTSAADAGTEPLCSACVGTWSAVVDPAGDLHVGFGTLSGIGATAVARNGGNVWSRPERHGLGVPSLAADIRGTYVTWVESSQARLRVLRRHHVLAADLGAPRAIPDGGAPLVASLEVADGGVLHNVGAWVDLDHPNAAQLTVTLTAPSGASYVLAQGGSAREWDGPVLFQAGGVAPQTSLAPLEGAALDGTWRLTVQDSSPGSAGVLRDFGLRFF